MKFHPVDGYNSNGASYIDGRARYRVPIFPVNENLPVGRKSGPCLADFVQQAAVRHDGFIRSRSHHQRNQEHRNQRKGYGHG